MSSQAAVHSIDALKDLRTALALYGEDTVAALGAIDAEVRRTLLWLEQDRPYYWQEQIHRRREKLASAEAEVFRRKLGKAAGSAPAMSEQIENMKRAKAALEDAERRVVLVRKWQKALPQAILEYQASVRRLRDLSAADVPRAVDLLGRLIESLEAYLRVSPPSMGAVAPAGPAGPELESIAVAALDAEPPRPEPAVDPDAGGPPDPEAS
jgi:hypothetical protein